KMLINPSLIRLFSSSVIIFWAASILACAILPLISSSIRTLSKWMEALNSSTHEIESSWNLPPQAFLLIHSNSLFKHRFHFSRQSEDFYEADRCFLIEGVFFRISCQFLIVKTVFRFASCNSDVSFI